MKRIISSLLFLAATTVFAEPAPFGLEIGKATVADAEKMYRIEKIRTNEDNFSGVISGYKVAVNQVNFDGLKELKIGFNKIGVLKLVYAKLPKSQFKSLHESLSKKYKVVSQEIPFVGNSAVQYVNGSTVVLLDAPHLSFDMSMIYIPKDMLSVAIEHKEEKDAAKKKSQEDQL